MLIGLCGYARSGKDSAAAVLKDIADFQKAGFADALREMALALNPAVAPNENEPDGLMRYADLVDAITYDEAKKLPEVRRFLQRLGTEAVRNVFGQDAWVDALRRRLEPLPAKANIVITDVRYDNEAAYVHEVGGHLWRIVRPGTQAANDHPSETTQRGFNVDYELVANDLQELRVAVSKAYAITAGVAVIISGAPIQGISGSFA